MLHASGGAPEIALSDGNLFAALRSHTATLEQNAPLFFRVRMQLALVAGIDFHDRYHRLIAGENAGLESFAERPFDALVHVMQVEKIVPTQEYSLQMVPARISDQQTVVSAIGLQTSVLHIKSNARPESRTPGQARIVRSRDGFHNGSGTMTLWTRVKDFVEDFGDSGDDAIDLGAEEVRLAAAALLVHATIVDGEVDRREGEVLRDVLERRFDLDKGQAGRLITQAAEKEKEAVDLYGFTSVLTRRLDRQGRLKIVEMLWEVVIADGVIHEFEANLVWRAAELLGVTSRDRIMLRKQVEDRHG